MGTTGDTVLVEEHVVAGVHWGEGDCLVLPDVGDLVPPGDHAGGGEDKEGISKEVVDRMAELGMVVDKGVLGDGHGKYIEGDEPAQLVVPCEGED